MKQKSRMYLINKYVFYQLLICDPKEIVDWFFALPDFLWKSLAAKFLYIH